MMDRAAPLFVVTALLVLMACSFYIGSTISTTFTDHYEEDRTAAECLRLPPTGVPKWLAADCRKLLGP